MELAELGRLPAHGGLIELNVSQTGDSPPIGTRVNVEIRTPMSVRQRILRKFSRDETDKFNLCCYCGHKFRFQTSSSSLRYHLDTKHPSWKDDEAFALPAPLSSISNVPLTSDQKRELENLIAQWLVNDVVPYDAVESGHFHELLGFLNSSVTIPCRETMKNRIMQAFGLMKNDVKAVLQSVDSKVSLTTDVWTSIEEFPFLILTAHWIDAQFNLRSIVVDIVPIPYSYKDETVQEALQAVLVEFGILQKTFAITTDTDSCVVSGAHLLAERLKHEHGIHLHVRRCMAHILEGIMKTGVLAIQSTIEKVREFVECAQRSSSIMRELNECHRAASSGAGEAIMFPKEVSSRWNDTYLMLVTYCKVIRAVESVTAGDPALAKYRLTSAEKADLVEAVEFLEPLYGATNSMSSSSFPTLALTTFFVDYIVETLKNTRDDKNFEAMPAWKVKAANEMWEKLRSHFEHIYSFDGYAGSILDPRIRKSLMPERLQSESFLDDFENLLREQYALDDSSDLALANDVNRMSFAEKIAFKRQRLVVRGVRDEVHEYLRNATIRMNSDVLSWWKENRIRFPRMAKMARDFLAVQATSVPSEHIFSKAGDVVIEELASLDEENVQPILCVRSWIRNGIKFRTQS